MGRDGVPAQAPSTTMNETAINTRHMERESFQSRVIHIDLFTSGACDFYASQSPPRAAFVPPVIPVISGWAKK
jgi:hypothetical protein